MLARAHSLLGLIVLGGYLGLHLVRQWPAIDGPRSWIQAHPALGSRLWLALPVLLALLGHAVLGVLRQRRRRAASAASVPTAAEAGLGRVQLFTGALALLFVGYHVARMWAHVAVDASAPHVAAYDAYATLWRTLGRPSELAVYIVGVTAVCFHFGHGLSRLLATWSASGSGPAAGRARLWARVLGGSIGALLWLGYLQVLGHFAVGEPVLPFGHHAPAQDAQPREDDAAVPGD